MKKIDIWVQPENLKKIEQWASEGYVQEDFAKKIGIARNTWAKWLKEQPEILEAVKKGASNPIGKVRDNLLSVCQWHEVVKRRYRVIDGEEVLVEVTREVRPPIEGCLKFYLTNRDAQNWENASKVNFDGTKLVIEGGEGLDV